MLPHHNPVGPPGPKGGVDTHIPLKGLSFEQLWHFLQIEYPQGPIEEVMKGIAKKFPDLRDWEEDDPKGVTQVLGKLLHDAGWPSDEKWNSIGQFYSFIRCMIACELVTDKDFRTGIAARQIQPFNYAPNNVDTIYPKKPFNKKAPAPDPDDPTKTKGRPNAAEVAVYTNEPDSHSGGHKDDWKEDEELITVSNKAQAMDALLTICEQGEGFKDPSSGIESNIDDPDKAPGGDGPSGTRNYEPEESHFFKFLRLQSQFVDYKEHKEKLPEWMKPEIVKMEEQEAGQKQYAKRSAASLIAGGMVYDYPSSPVSAQYPNAYAAINDFNSGLFQYMLVLSETIYLVKPEMVGQGKQVHSQQQFFNVALHRSMIWIMDKWILMMREMDPMPSGPLAQKIMAPSFENLSLGTREDAFETLKALGARAVAAGAQIGGYTESRTKELVAKAISLMGPDNQHPMHLPNVKEYWDGNAPIAPGDDGASAANIAAE